MMNPNTEFLEQQFQDLVGVPVQALLEDIEHNPPYGVDLKLNGVYSAINKERKADDPSLPMGQWKHDLNMANWDEVSRIAVDALSKKSKDLQIAIWLLEAQIHKHGFSAIAPCIHFIHRLTEKYWDGLYPQIEDEAVDLEYRTNLIIWVNSKLQPIVKQLPITLTRNDQVFSWADWEMATQYEQLPPDQKKELGEDFIQTNSIVTAIIATHIDFYKSLFVQLELALQAIDEYGNYLDELLGNEAPPLNSLRSLISDIYATLYSHVKHRGLEASSNEEDVESENNNASVNESSGSGGGSGPIKGRNDAYARLAEAAEYLVMDDPHSPVPYLVYKAIEWGQLNTAELYQELFVQYQGQLNIFEILGLDLSSQPQQKR